MKNENNSPQRFVIFITCGRILFDSTANLHLKRKHFARTTKKRNKEKNMLTCLKKYLPRDTKK